MNCKEAIDIAEEAIDKDLPRAVKRRLDLHLSRCAACRRLFEAERAEHGRWFRAFNDPAAMRSLPPGFADRLAASVRLSRPSFWFRVPRWLKRAACFALLLFGAAFAAAVVVEAIGAKDGEATESAAEDPCVPDVALAASGETPQSCDSQLEIENKKGETEMNSDQNSAAALATATLEEERGMAMKVRQFVDTIKMASLAALTVFSADAAQGEDAYIESDGTSVINTGVMPNADLRIEVDYAFTDASERDTRIFGVYVDDGKNANIEYYVNPTGGLAFHVGHGWVGGEYVAMIDKKRYTAIADISNGQFHLVTGTTTNKTVAMKANPGLSAVGTAPIGLFGRIADANGSSDVAKVRSKSRILPASVRESICPCATTMRADGQSPLSRFSTFAMDATRLCRKYTCPPRAISASIAERTVSSESRTMRVSTATRSRGGDLISERSRAPVIER